MRECITAMLAMVSAVACFGEQAFGVNLIRIQGTINPATANYIERATTLTGENESICLIIELDTPGGLLDSTKTIVQSFYRSPVPIVVYVAPTGANAGSAGCFITLAADVAAMAPNTSIGAAHPVQMGGSDSETNETMNQKMENFAASYIEAIADKRGRNSEWAISAVRDSASITAEKALELNVIEIIAKDIEDLLEQINSREVNGHVLQTSGAIVEEIPMLLREEVFQMIWRPEIMFILMLIAIYGIIGELNSPGMFLPGIIGVVSLILVLYMAAVLPINVAGISLMVLAVGLFVAEAFTPTFGALTIGGVLSFFLGSLMLFDRGYPEFHLSLGVIIPGTLITTAFFVFVVGAGLRAQRLPVRVGRETILGMQAEALTRIDAQAGHVCIDGEDWACTSEIPVRKGQLVQVVDRDGLQLIVKPLEKEDSS